MTGMPIKACADKIKRELETYGFPPQFPQVGSGLLVKYLPAVILPLLEKDTEDLLFYLRSRDRTADPFLEEAVFL